MPQQKDGVGFFLPCGNRRMSVHIRGCTVAESIKHRLISIVFIDLTGRMRADGVPRQDLVGRSRGQDRTRAARVAVQSPNRWATTSKTACACEWAKFNLTLGEWP